jgi:hypothetical protein
MLTGAFGIPEVRRMAIKAFGPPWVDTALADTLVLALDTE